MKKIKLYQNREKNSSLNEYDLNPTEKYVIDMDEEMEFQAAIMMSFQIMGPPPAIKNYHAWLFENGFDVNMPNPTNTFVSTYYGVKPLWKTAYSQGIVVMQKTILTILLLWSVATRTKAIKIPKSFSPQVVASKKILSLSNTVGNLKTYSIGNI